MAFPMYTLSCGNGGLPIGIARHHDLRYGHAITRIDNDAEGVTLHWRVDGKEGLQRVDACVSAVPPPVVLGLAPRLAQAERRFFEALRYTSMLAVHFGLRRRPSNSETVLMYPERESHDLAAVYVNHNEAPGRAPHDKGSLSAYFTQDWSQQNFDFSDESLLALARERLRPHYQYFEAHIEDAFVHRWPLFALSSTPGVYRLMDEYQCWLLAAPTGRLQFAGDFLPNSGVNQAMCSGANAAARIEQSLQ